MVTKVRTRVPALLSRDPVARPRARILLVDDEPKNLVALQAVLEGEDRELVWALSGKEALRALLDGDFALIVLDVHMPDMDGFETAELIRGREQTREIPILFVTAAIRGEFAVSRGYALGAVDYLLRPLDPGILRFKVGLFVDLYTKTAELRRQSAELAEARDLLASVVQGATEHGIAAISASGEIISWNEGAHRIYGYPAGEVLGSPLAGLFAPACADMEGVLAAVRAQGRYVGECDQLRADGTAFPARLALSQRIDGGRYQGYVFIAQDITPEREAARAKTEVAELRAASALKDEFLGLVSHELRTPLTTILGNSQTLVRRGGEIPPETVTESLEEISASARRLQSMIESMLLLSHLAGGQELELEPVMLQRIIPGVVREFEGISTGPVRLTIAEGLPPVLAHPTYVQQIVFNLLSNAVKYSQGRPQIDVAVEPAPGEAVRVAVLDRGLGISEEEAAEVFRPFTRLSRTQFQAPGAGLGLTVCSRLAAALGGDVRAEPRPGGGSVFSFTLNAVDLE